MRNLEQTPFITVNIWQQVLELETDPVLFSPRQADRGTLAMMSLIELRPGDFVLDLGCGYGLVGLAAAKALSPDQVVMVDNDPLAVLVAGRNAHRNGLDGVRIIGGYGPEAAAPDFFSLIFCNPPYHSDFSVARNLIEQSRERLSDGGRLVLVVKRLNWYQKKMAAVFGGVQVRLVDGYYVLLSEKRARPVKGPDPGKIPSPASTTRKHQKKLDAAARSLKKRPRRQR
jgi:16S rRNA (guanine1207-N2)-methyltransferase